MEFTCYFYNFPWFLREIVRDIRLKNTDLRIRIKPPAFFLAFQAIRFFVITHTKEPFKLDFAFMT